MRRGFEGNIYCNTGSASSPTWTEVDAVGDVTIEDDSEIIDTTVRSTNGIKTSARGLLSVKTSIVLESEASPDSGSPLAKLRAAAKLRDGFVDLFFSNTNAASGATGVRALLLVTRTDEQKMGDRWTEKFDLTPARATGDWITANVAPLNQSYTVG